MAVMTVNDMTAEELGALREQARARLEQQAQRARRFRAYYDGRSPLIAMTNSQERRAFEALTGIAAEHWCELIVNAVAQRLRVAQFRFADQAASDDAWAIWQASRMDADSKMVHRDALVTGSGFVLVQPDPGSPAGVSITPESPAQVTVLYEPGNRRARAAGYKRFASGQLGEVTEIVMTPGLTATWEPGRPDPVLGPGGPQILELAPQPQTDGWPRSELEPATVSQDRIVNTHFQTMVAADYGAHRQVWASGVRMARRVMTEDGGEVTKAVRPFNLGADRLLVNEDPQGRFGAFPGDDLAGYLAAVEADVRHLAAITQTPPHYLLGEMANLSADAIKAAEAGLVSKVAERSLFLGEAWEDVLRCAFALTGHPGAGDMSAEVVWADFETRSEGQRVDALVKMRTLGVPLEVLWERWGTSPQEISRWKRLAAEEAAGSPESAYARLLNAAAPSA